MGELNKFSRPLLDTPEPLEERVDSFEQIAEDSRKRAREDIRNAIAIAAQLDPDEVGKQADLAQQTGIPASTLVENPEQAEALKKSRAFTDERLDKMAEDFPVFYEKMTTDPAFAAMVQDDIEHTSTFEGILTDVKVWHEDIGRAAARGVTNYQMNLLGARRLYLVMNGEDLSPENIQRILDLQAANRGPLQPSKERGFIASSPFTLAEQLPNILGSIGADMLGRVTGRSVAAGIGVLGAVAAGQVPPLTLAAEEVITVPASAAVTSSIGGEIGARLGVFVHSAVQEGGAAMVDFSTMRDEDGNMLDLRTAASFAALTGIINGGLEALSYSKLKLVMPGGIGTRAIKREISLGISRLIKNPTTRKRILDALKRQATATATETLTEGVQEAVLITFQELLKIVDKKAFEDAGFGDLLDAKTLGEFVSQIFTAGGGGFQVATLLGLPTTARRVSTARGDTGAAGPSIADAFTPEPPQTGAAEAGQGEAPTPASQPPPLLRSGLDMATSETTDPEITAASRQLFQDVGEVQGVARDQRLLDALPDFAEKSKLRERSPETFSDFISQAINKAVGNDSLRYVRVSGEALNAHFQEVEGARALFEPIVDGLDKQLEQAVATGGDVLVPIGDYAAHIAPTDSHAAIRGDLKLREGVSTSNQLLANHRDVQREFERLFRERMASNEDDEAADQVSEALEVGFVDQIERTGRVASKKATKTSAKIIAAAVRTMARRSTLSVQEFQRRMGPTIVSDEQQPAVPPGAPATEGAEIETVSRTVPDTVSDTLEQALLDDARISDPAVVFETFPSQSLGYPIALDTSPEGVPAAQHRADRTRFSRASHRVIQNEAGENELAQVLGLEATDAEGSGLWAGTISPNFVSQFQMDPATRDATRAAAYQYARAVQYIYQQDAVPVIEIMLPIVGEPPVKEDPLATGALLEFREDITLEQEEQLRDELSTRWGDMAGYIRLDGHRILLANFRGNDGQPLMATDKDFLTAVDEILSGNKEAWGIIDSTTVRLDSELLEHDWTEDPEGERILDDVRRHEGKEAGGGGGVQESPADAAKPSVLQNWIHSRRLRQLEILRAFGGKGENLAPTEAEGGRDPAREPGREGVEAAKPLFQEVEQEVEARPPPVTAPQPYSATLRAVQIIPQEKATPEQWLSMISKTPGVKKEEMDFLQLEEFLHKSVNMPGEKPTKTVTRQDLMDHIELNRVRIEILGAGRDGAERVGGDTASILAALEEEAEHEWIDTSDPVWQVVYERLQEDEDKGDIEEMLLADDPERYEIEQDPEEDIDRAARDARDQIEEEQKNLLPGTAETIDVERAVQVRARDLIDNYPQEYITDVDPEIDYDALDEDVNMVADERIQERMSGLAQFRFENGMRIILDPSESYEGSEYTVLDQDGGWVSDHNDFQSAIAGLLEHLEENGDSVTGRTRHLQYTVDGGTNYREVRLVWENAPEGMRFVNQAHFNDVNVNGYFRAKDRFFVIPDPLEDLAHDVGDRTIEVSALEEIQNDIHQRGRDKGYKEPDHEAKKQRLRDQATKTQAAADEYGRQLRERLTEAVKNGSIGASQVNERFREQIALQIEHDTRIADRELINALGLERRVLAQRVVENDRALQHGQISQQLFDNVNRELDVRHADLDQREEAARAERIHEHKQTEVQRLMGDPLPQEAQNRLEGIESDVHEGLITRAEGDRRRDLIAPNAPPRTRGISMVGLNLEGALDPQIRRTAFRLAQDGTIGALFDEDVKLLALQDKANRIRGESMTHEQRVDSAPFKKTWHEVVLKHALIDAVNRGKNALAWTPGIVHVRRWNKYFRENLDHVDWRHVGNELYQITAFPANAAAGTIEREVAGRDLTEMLGADNSRDIQEAASHGRDEGVLQGGEMKVPKAFLLNLYDKKAVQYLNKVGKKHGAKVVEIVDEGNTWWVFEIPESLEETIRGNSLPLHQADEATPTEPHRVRGLYLPDERLVKLTKDANLSTIMHEVGGHWYLHTLNELSQMEGTAPDVRQDLETIFKWLGVASFDEITRDHHEIFADGFLKYLSEGKAPTQKMVPVFQRFRSWLMALYRAGDLQRMGGIELSDEVRDVFDRMLATDEEVQDARHEAGARAIFMRRSDAPELTDREWDEYVRNRDKIVEDATRRRDEVTMRRANRKETKVYKKRLSETKKRVRKEFEEDPAFQAKRFLLHGELPDGEVEENHQLDREALMDIVGSLPDGKELMSRLPFGQHAIDTKNNGIHPDYVAELFGFNSGEALLRAVVEFSEKNIERRVKEEATSRLELEGVVDPSLDPTTEAMEALHNEGLENMLLAEIEVFERRSGKRGVPVRRLKAFASSEIAETAVGDIKPEAYLNRERRQAQLAFQQTLRGNYDEAADSRRRQLLNMYLYREARDKTKKISRILADVKRYRRGRTRKAIGADYIEQIDDLLGRFDFRVGTPFRTQKTQTLGAFISAQRELGKPVRIDEAVVGEHRGRMTYKSLTVGEFEGIHEALRNIEKLGRLEQEIRVGELRQRVEEIRQTTIETLEENLPGETFEVTGRGGYFQPVKDGLLAWHAHLRRMSHLFLTADGGNTNGKLYRIWMRTADEAGDRQHTMQRELYDKLMDILGDYSTLRLRKMIQIDGTKHSMSFEELLALGLNWGNIENRTRILELEESAPGLNALTIPKMLDKLEQKDWEKIQAVWDLLETMWPAIADLERRTTGTMPKRVEAMAVNTRFGAFRGGYYPIRYDPRASAKTEQRALEQTAEQVISQMGALAHAQTKQGHLKARIGSGGQKLKMSLDVIPQHINDVVHDITHRELVMMYVRLLRDKPTADAMQRSFGPAMFREFERWVTRVANTDRVESDQFQRLIGHLRGGVAASVMGWKVTVAMQQPLGITQSISRIGPAAVARGLGHSMRAIATGKMGALMTDIHARSEFMRNRSETINREVSEVFRRLHKANALSKVETSMFYFIQKAQAMVDVPTWIGEYNKHLAKGVDEVDAAALADRAVKESQGSGSKKDLSGVEVGTQAKKLFTTFYSFFNTTYNLSADSIARVRFQKDPLAIPKLASDFLLLYTIPALLGEIILDRGPDDDESWVAWAIREQIGFMLATMPFVRDVGSAFEYGREAPAGLATGRLANVVVQASQGDADVALLKAALEALAIVGPLHFPASQINTTIQGFEDLKSGKTDNPLSLLIRTKSQRN